MSHVIADYGPGDLAFAEVAQRIKFHLPDAEPLYTPVPAFATLATSTLAGQIEPSTISEVPTDRLAYADGYGNLKTNTEQDALAASTGAGLRISETERGTIVSDGTFEVEEGELAFAPGSSGWPRTDGEAVRWMELFLRGGSVWEVFGRPDIGARLGIAPHPRNSSGA